MKSKENPHQKKTAYEEQGINQIKRPHFELLQNVHSTDQQTDKGTYREPVPEL